MSSVVYWNSYSDRPWDISGMPKLYNEMQEHSSVCHTRAGRLGTIWRGSERNTGGGRERVMDQRNSVSRSLLINVIVFVGHF